MMKKLFFVLLTILGLSFGTSAQQVAPAAKTKTEKSKTTEKKEKAVLKKDGTPDKRYKSNKKLKKDGTPDKRYKDNKKD